MRCSELYKNVDDMLDAMNEIERYLSVAYIKRVCKFLIDEDNFWTMKGMYYMCEYYIDGERDANKIKFKIDKVIGDVNTDNLSEVDFNLFPDIVTGSAYFRNNELTSLKGLKDKVIKGDIHLNNSGITTLEDLPNKLNNSLWCSNTNLITLDGCPEYIRKNMIISNNKLKLVDNLPSYIGGNLDISNNPIDSFSKELLNKNITIKGNLILGKKLSFLKDMIPNCWKIEKEII